MACRLYPTFYNEIMEFSLISSIVLRVGFYMLSFNDIIKRDMTNVIHMIINYSEYRLYLFTANYNKIDTWSG